MIAPRILLAAALALAVPAGFSACSPVPVVQH